LSMWADYTHNRSWCVCNFVSAICKSFSCVILDACFSHLYGCLCNGLFAYLFNCHLDYKLLLLWCHLFM
jgi:hypothetical protein